mmetsp:Transcript_49178/g.140369  ORF Transcript_49178/g.140369 Transcript_49178/m.140369 type:complete len:231 (-) Transcript_49178:224-916(-)
MCSSTQEGRSSLGWPPQSSLIFSLHMRFVSTSPPAAAIAEGPPPPSLAPCAFLSTASMLAKESLHFSESVSRCCAKRHFARAEAVFFLSILPHLSGSMRSAWQAVITRRSSLLSPALSWSTRKSCFEHFLDSSSLCARRQGRAASPLSPAQSPASSCAQASSVIKTGACGTPLLAFAAAPGEPRSTFFTSMMHADVTPLLSSRPLSAPLLAAVFARHSASWPPPGGTVGQ